MKEHSQIVDDNYTRSVNQYIGVNYTRLNTLRELVYQTYGNSSIQDATKLNIFVDLASVLHGLYSEHNRVTTENITDISASIINLCAHYRGFFRNDLGVDTRIFLINSTNTCDINRKFVADYNADLIRKMGVTQTIKMIESNMKLLEILCPYLPAIYYIDSPQHFETSVIIAHIIETLKDENPNLIISHDMYPLQLCAQYKWTSYLYPKKTREANGFIDTSWMLPVNDKPNFKEEFWKAYAAHRNLSPGIYQLVSQISPINYPLLISLVSFPERSLKAVMHIATAMRFITNIAGTADIKVQSAQFMGDPQYTNSYPVGNIDARYKAMDVQYMLPYYRSSPEAMNIKMLDLNDPGAVNTIVSKYYANNPIDLMKL